MFFDYSAILTIGYAANRIGMRGTSFREIVFYVLVFLFLAADIRCNSITKREFLISGLLFVFFFFFYAYGAMFYPKNFELDINGFSPFHLLLYCQAAVLVFMRIDNFDVLIQYITYGARFFSIITFLNMYLSFTRNEGTFATNGYDMVAGYQAALCCLPLLYSLSKKFNIFDSVLAIAMFVLATLGGSRGSLLVILVYMAVGIFKKYFIEKRFMTKALFIFSICIIIPYVYNNYVFVIKSLTSTLSRWGIYSRTLDGFLTKEIVADSGRALLHRSVISSWNDMPIIGYGILGDRAANQGAYVHNFLIEVITDYGYAIGALVICLLIFGIILGIISEKKRSLVLLLLSYVGVMLAISGSYVVSTLFYVSLGILLAPNGTVGKEELVFADER